MILSNQESAEAIRSAKDALENYKRFFFGNAKLESELYDLGLVDSRGALYGSRYHPPGDHTC
jgi:hypothetical protein